MSDCFVLETPVAKKRQPSLGRDEIQFPLSNGSFASISQNHENFGDWDWGSFHNSKGTISLSNNEGEIQKEGKNMDSFDLTERKSVPKLPISRREIRKVNMYEQNQLATTIQTGSGLDGESDFSVTASMNSFNNLRSESTRSLQRSVSDVGSFRRKGASKASQKGNEMSLSFHSEMSLSFSNRRQQFSKPSLLNQIGERRQSYRNVEEEEEGEDEPQPQNQPSGNDEDFEGIMRSKASPSNDVVKKRSSSKDRLKKKGHARTNSTGIRSEDRSLDEYGQLRPIRIASHGSRSSASSGRRRTTNPSPSDSNRSVNRKSRKKNEATDLSSDLERESMLVEVRRERNSRRLSEKGHPETGPQRPRSRNTIMDGSNGKSGQLKKSTGRETHGSSEEANKYSSRCNNRRVVCRRTSMTGNIVDTESDHPKTRRRSSMDHYKPNSPADRPKDTRSRRSSMDHYKPNSPADRPKDIRRRRASMDHYTASSRSSNYLPVEKPKTKSNIIMALSTHVGDEGSLFPPRIPFGEEGTVTTKDISEESLSFRNMQRSHNSLTNDQIRPLSRKSSVAYRDRQPSRKTTCDPSKESSHNSRQKTDRIRSDLGRQRQRQRSTHSLHHQSKEDTIAEILALVASTPNRDEISGEGESLPLPKNRRSRSSDPIDRNSGSTFSSTGSRRLSRDRSRNRSTENSAPRGKSRSKSRSRSHVQTTPHRSSSFYNIRKGKRVGHQSGESSPQEESPKKKEKHFVMGKKNRRGYRNRRASAL
jgi:hypothetical protein